MVNAELLYVPDCPNLDLARQRPTEAAARAGIEVVVQGHLVADADAAAELGMHGSPTILIDGGDVAGDSEPSMSSRCPHPMRAAVASMAACCAVHLGPLVAVAASGWSVAVAVAALLLVLFLSVRSRRSAGADCC